MTNKMNRKQKIEVLNAVRARLYNLQLEADELLTKTIGQEVTKDFALRRVLEITVDAGNTIGQIDLAFPKGDRSDEGDGLRAEHLPRIQALALDIFTTIKAVQRRIDFRTPTGDAEWDKIVRMVVVKENAHKHHDSELLTMAHELEQKLNNAF